MLRIRVYHYEWYENEDYEWTECEIFVHSEEEEQAREMLPSLAKKYPECYITLDNKDGKNIAFYYSVKGKLKDIGGLTLL